MKSEIILPQICYDEIINQLDSNLPYEACGFLSGNCNQIKTVWPLINQLQSSNRFFVDKKVVNMTLEQINIKQEKLIATYHSHPTTLPTPSYSDLKNHMSKDILMMIVSFKYQDPIMKLFNIDKNNYFECLFRIKT
ncbi:hypothetical protein E3U55_12700 [Filobacillus milosensis]|uniref:JAB1/MPN/MOV34 metalloenzyme domain-containing protein n=1 Tax=Filobacillus milosensis TaxID=94137 RepID=A0A4Y8IIP3_9BACI|nr:Mov34/MPN/PAD-1 family protein [Filobacillus milosensis]TFB15105.1 hypothetical protein E3U55_12700 [Filobacillus milosensis]